ncbi:MAG: FKBP-type peptidyl-prolyl cis-trans isomerase, partial [Myxococcota bacterium]
MRRWLPLFVLCAMAGCSRKPAQVAVPSAPLGITHPTVSVLDARSEAPRPEAVDESWLAVHDNGLKTYDIVVGAGAQVVPGQTVHIAYTGWLKDGTMFDSSVHSGRAPLEVRLGQGGLLEGLNIGLAAMTVGGLRQLEMPNALAYGPMGPPPTIPPHATVVFDLEMVAA